MSRSAPPVTLEITTSRAQQALIALAGLAALGAVWISGLPFAVQIAVSLLAVALAAHAWRSTSKWNGARFVFDVDEPSRARLADRSEHEVEIVDATLLGPLIAVRLKLGGRRADLALFPDSGAPDDLRRLRVFLRHALKR